MEDQAYPFLKVPIFYICLNKISLCRNNNLKVLS